MTEQTASSLTNEIDPLVSAELMTLQVAAAIFIVAALISMLFWIMRSRPMGIGSYILGLAGAISLTATLVIRTIHTGHVPYVQLYETFIFSAWACAIVAVFADPWMKSRLPSTIANILSAVLLLYVWQFYDGPTEGQRLRAVLQSPWLDIHIATAFLGYAAFAISAGAGIVYFFTKNPKVDDLSYRMVAFGFPLLGLCIIMGAVWANEAWGRYWGWDPKETASLVTWLIYAGYLHARLAFGWKGTRASILNLVGFGCVIFTWIGLNIVAKMIELETLHAYTG